MSPCQLCPVSAALASVDQPFLVQTPAAREKTQAGGAMSPHIIAPALSRSCCVCWSQWSGQASSCSFWVVGCHLGFDIPSSFLDHRAL